MLQNKRSQWLLSTDEGMWKAHLSLSFTQTLVTLPDTGAETICSIFMAESTQIL